MDQFARNLVRSYAPLPPTSNADQPAAAAPASRPGTGAGTGATTAQGRAVEDFLSSTFGSGGGALFGKVRELEDIMQSVKSTIQQHSSALLDLRGQVSDVKDTIHTTATAQASSIGTPPSDLHGAYATTNLLDQVDSVVDDVDADYPLHSRRYSRQRQQHSLHDSGISSTVYPPPDNAHAMPPPPPPAVDSFLSNILTHHAPPQPEEQDAMDVDLRLNRMSRTLESLISDARSVLSTPGDSDDPPTSSPRGSYDEDAEDAEEDDDDVYSVTSFRSTPLMRSTRARLLRTRSSYAGGSVPPPLQPPSGGSHRRRSPLGSPVDASVGDRDPDVLAARRAQRRATILNPEGVAAATGGSGAHQATLDALNGSHPRPASSVGGRRPPIPQPHTPATPTSVAPVGAEQFRANPRVAGFPPHMFDYPASSNGDLDSMTTARSPVYDADSGTRIRRSDLPLPRHPGRPSSVVGGVYPPPPADYYPPSPPRSGLGVSPNPNVAAAYYDDDLDFAFDARSEFSVTPSESPSGYFRVPPTPHAMPSVAYHAPPERPRYAASVFSDFSARMGLSPAQRASMMAAQQAAPVPMVPAFTRAASQVGPNGGSAASTLAAAMHGAPAHMVPDPTALLEPVPPGSVLHSGGSESATATPEEDRASAAPQAASGFLGLGPKRWLAIVVAGYWVLDSTAFLWFLFVLGTLFLGIKGLWQWVAELSEDIVELMILDTAAAARSVPGKEDKKSRKKGGDRSVSRKRRSKSAKRDPAAVAA
ncbi:hypothetical protein H9P43_008706 [Blastocladiella emersonii ATCC 22665]|nr:hypothetical protein H9P43_008706 [Blastocladiella emersonii ATCC 22665]